MEDLFRFFARQNSPSSPSSNNPADYPRSVKIEDGDALMTLALLERLSEERGNLVEEMQKVRERIEIITAEHSIASTKLFQRLREMHPDVYARDMTGWRKWEGDYFYVGWQGENT